MDQHNRTLTGDPPTDRQAEMLACIRGHIREHGTPPTVREIGAAMGIRSPNGVICHLNALVRKGLLRKNGRGTSRGWTPTDLGRPRCEHCGQVIPEAQGAEDRGA